MRLGLSGVRAARSILPDPTLFPGAGQESWAADPEAQAQSPVLLAGPPPAVMPRVLEDRWSSVSERLLEGQVPGSFGVQRRGTFAPSLEACRPGPVGGGQ